MGFNFKQLGKLGDAFYGDKVNGAILSKFKIEPKASAATTGITNHKLFAVGDVSGTTAFGFGAVAHATTGIMGCFGRTAVATGTQTDTGLDIRVINKLTNTGVNAIQGAYIKSKNYSGATVGSLVGLFVEAVCDGTVTNGGIALKIGSDASTLKYAIDMSNCVVTNGADIKLSSGLTIGSGSAAPTHAAATGSLYIRTGQSDQKAMLYLCTVASGTWVLLNTVTA